MYSNIVIQNMTFGIVKNNELELLYCLSVYLNVK